MLFKYRLPLVFFFSLLILVFSVDAVHRPSPSHARRSLAFKKKSQRQLGDITFPNLSDLVNGVVGGGTSSTPGPTSSSTPPGSTSSPTDSSTNTNPPSTSTTPSSSGTPSTTPTPSTSDPPSSSSSSPTTSPTPSTTDPGSSSSSSSPTDTPTSTPPTTTPPSSSPSPTSSIPPNCLLDLLGNCVPSSSSSPPVSSTSDTSVTTSTTPTPSSPTSSPTDLPTSLPQQSTPTSSSDTPTPTSTSSPDCPLGVVIGGVCVLPSSTPTPPASSSIPPSTSEPPPSTSPPSTTPDLGQSSSSPSPTTPEPGSSSSPTPTPTSSPPVDPCGPVGVALGLCTSNSSPPASTSPLTSTPPSPSPSPSGSSPSSTPPPTSSPSPSIDPCGDQGISLGLCTPSVVPSSTTSTQLPSQSTDPCDSAGIALGLCPSSSLPPVSSSSSPPATITPQQSCDSLGLCSSTTTSNSGTQIPSETSPSSDTPSKTQSQPSLSSGQSSSPSDVSTGLSDSSSGTSSSSIPVISFPSGTNSDVSSITSFSSTSTNDRSLPALTPPPQTQLSYVTATSLLLATPVTSSFSDTLSDPDVPPTLTFATTSNSLPTTTPINLPPDLPARIYPPEQVDLNSLSDYSLVSVLFAPSLSWTFVAGSSQVQGELLLWMPNLVATSLDINPAQVMTFALQVYVPETYQGPGDASMLLTTYLMYIPTQEVPVLANQIRVASSAFYTSMGEPYHTLAHQVNPAFPVNSVEDPNAVPGTTSTVTPSRNKSRTDAIIGVTSALGGLALGALGVLVYRSVKRSRDLRHRRLADSNAPNASYPDRTGRDFDQDSIGGQRRRSFYFAEDSLRGQEAVQQTAVPVAQPQGQHVIQPVSQVEYSYRTSPDGVRERRAPVVTGAISAPILTQSSLNW